MKVRQLLNLLLDGNLDDEVEIQISERNHLDALIEFKRIPVSYVMSVKEKGKSIIAIENSQVKTSDWRKPQ